jgi:hypothetical protein
LANFSRKKSRNIKIALFMVQNREFKQKTTAVKWVLPSWTWLEGGLGRSLPPGRGPVPVSSPWSLG